MSAHKRQFWLMPNETDLVLTAIDFMLNRLDNETGNMPAHAASGRYTKRQLQELRKKFAALDRVAMPEGR